jgi:general secretion pathway protein C
MKLGGGRLAARIEIVSTSVLTVFSRVALPWRGIGALIIGVLLARWTWILFAPQTLAVIPTKSDVPGKAPDAIFGISVAPGAATKNADAVLGSVHLVGVFSGTHGFAVLKLDEKIQRGVALGEDVVKGTKLVAVAADHVVLERNGIRQQVNLESKSTNNKGIVLESAASVSGVKQAVDGWSQAQQEMHKK